MRKGRFGEYKVIPGSMLPTFDLRLAYTNRSEVGSFGVNAYINSDVTFQRIKDSEVLLIGYTLPASTAILASDEQVLLCSATSSSDQAPQSPRPRVGDLLRLGLCQTMLYADGHLPVSMSHISSCRVIVHFYRISTYLLGLVQSLCALLVGVDHPGYELLSGSAGCGFSGSTAGDFQ